jgi:ABC-2 type transport system permease protein
VAGLTFSRETRGQFAAIASVRWQLFANSLRTLRGRFEMVSRIFIVLAFAGGGLGGAMGVGATSYFFASQGKIEWLAFLLWPIFLFWQLFPVMATAFTENVDSSNLLRFPLSYPSYFLIRLVYGAFDPATAMGCFWLFAMAVGIGFAEPLLFLWAVVVLLAFAIVNILLGRMIFAWVERWLAQRRTREILGVLFFLIIISFQFIGPLASRYGGKRAPGMTRVAEQVLPVERLLPPGLAAAAIAQATQQAAVALGALGLLGVYAFAFLALLHIRLRAQFRGENLSESTAQRKTLARGQSARYAGWAVPGLPGPCAAILEKESRYLARSGPILFTLVMPVVILLIFRLTPGNSGKGGGFLVHAPDLAFPVGAAYALLILTNLVYNNFGPDAAGVQFFFASPVRLREVLIAKNLAHSAVVGIEVVLVYLGVCFLYRPPAAGATLATLAGILFALPVNLSIGNLLSIYSPKKIDFGTFGRQKASGSTQLAAFGSQAALFGIAAVVVLASRIFGSIWLATILFLVLAAFAFLAYVLLLNRAEQMALDRREIMISELSRA